MGTSMHTHTCTPPPAPSPVYVGGKFEILTVGTVCRADPRLVTVGVWVNSEIKGQHQGPGDGALWAMFLTSLIHKLFV